eukprot:symbB.v1.2.025508.t2/scaffold2452.1/size150514/9
MLSVQQMEFLEDLWRSIGLEVVIFVVTLCCAFLVRSFSPKGAVTGRKVVTTSPQHKVIEPKATGFRRISEPRNLMNAAPADILHEVMQGLQEQNGHVSRPARILGLYAELGHVLKKSGRTLQEVAGNGQTANDLYTGLAQLVIRTGKHQSLDSIMDDMIEHQVPRSLAFYESVMKQLAVQKQFRLALRIYDRLVEDGLETTAVTYSCLIRFAAEVGDFTRAKFFFEKLSSLTTPSIREGELRRPSTGYPITHDRRTSAPFLRQGIPSAATTQLVSMVENYRDLSMRHEMWHYSGPDVLSHEEEAELEALRSQAARLRQEALREDASRDELERQVELLGREYRLALDEQHRLEGQLQMATSRLAKSAESAETAGQEEQAMDSARRLLANLLTSDLKKVAWHVKCCDPSMCEAKINMSSTEFPGLKTYWQSTPGTGAYMTILGVHNKRQDWKSALAVIQDMKARGAALDSLALNVALSTGVAADKVDEVLDLLAEAEQMERCFPDVVSYNTLIKAFAQRANYTAACEQRKVYPNPITFNTVMDAAVRAGRPNEAWARLEDMRKRGFKPDKFTCSILVKAFCKSGQTVNEAVVRRGNASVPWYFPAGQESVDRALALLDESNDCLDMTLKATLYNNVLDVTTKADLNASILNIMQQMRVRGVK